MSCSCRCCVALFVFLTLSPAASWVRVFTFLIEETLSNLVIGLVVGRYCLSDKTETQSEKKKEHPTGLEPAIFSLGMRRLAIGPRERRFPVSGN